MQDGVLNPRQVVADQLIIDAFCDTAKLATLLLRFVPAGCGCSFYVALLK